MVDKGGVCGGGDMALMGGEEDAARLQPSQQASAGWARAKADMQSAWGRQHAHLYNEINACAQYQQRCHHSDDDEEPVEPSRSLHESA